MEGGPGGLNPSEADVYIYCNLYNPLYTGFYSVGNTGI